MKLHTYLSQERGRAAMLARALRVKPPTISEWRRGVKRVPITQCLPIERATGGEVTRADLRDDWRTVWPDYKQKPSKRK
ncbi:helix-turn-helix domain-containing protein [Bordetella hinzii]|uniref:transcriptional regulator n=1 Tax=Bordetella hinzii TaxID=103855 RepID=UPI0013EFC79E|nr:YdaS family helix-turn-helix protein [Bordetella hinzii]QII84188.1 helix-turn-helix domain-containing protein [Bordetella hinzii]